MLKFIKYHMETIAGIEIYPIISFLIFFTFFIALLYFTFSASKDHISTMSQMPLNDGAHSSDHTSQS